MAPLFVSAPFQLFDGFLGHVPLVLRIVDPEKQIQRSVLIGLRLIAAVLALKVFSFAVFYGSVTTLRAMLRGIRRRHKHHLYARLGRLKEKTILYRASDPFAQQVAYLSAVFALKRKAMRQIFQGIDLRRALPEDVGLGLSIALRICERMGWQIRLLDQTDRSEKLSWATGAVFAVTLTGSAPVRKDMSAENG